MTRRQEQLNSQIRELLGLVIQTEMQDPRLQAVTVSRVQVNRDASHAMIFFTVVSDEITPAEAEEGLNHARGYLRRVLAETLDLRYTPDLTFRYDQATEETKRVLDLLEEIDRQRIENPPPPEDG